MRYKLIEIYGDDINANNVFVTGTPQFDFHSK